VCNLERFERVGSMKFQAFFYWHIINVLSNVTFNIHDGYN